MNSARSTCFLLIVIFGFAESSKILCLTPIASKSHMNVFRPLMQELASRDHDITVISPFKENKPVKNIREITMEYDYSKTVALDKELFNLLQVHELRAFFSFNDYFMPFCKHFLKDSRIQKLVTEGQQFDVVIINGFMNECALTIAPLLSKHIIWLTPNALMPWTKFFVPRPPSYVPNMFLPYTAKMNFFQRLNNIFVTVGQNLIMDYQIIPEIEHFAKIEIPVSLPIDEAMKKVDFVLANVDPVMITPRPTMPNIVNVGGMHCKEAKQLPKEFDDFVKSSGDDGFIIFSLGSIAQVKLLPREKREAFINAFSKLKQKVLWKYEGKLDKLPSNFKITSWLPQQDLIGHPKCRLLVAHGGLLSLQEAVYHGVPAVVVPIYGDQPANAARVAELGIGEKIDLNTLTTEEIYKTIHKVLSNNRYLENAKKYSAISRDQYQRPEKRAAFWVEYVIRHQGAKHFRSAGERLNFFQYFLLDIAALFTLAFSVLSWCLYIITRALFCKFYRCKAKEVKKAEQTKKKQ